MIQLIRTSRYEHIHKFALFGERHSGTKFLTECLNCFGLDSTQFFGHKHFFGFANPNRITIEMHTIFICIVRNPYQWLLAMYELPHHVPHSKRSSLDNLIDGEWYSIDSNKSEIIQDRNFNTPKPYDRYANIFEMRATKCRYMLETVPLFAKNYLFLTYETFTLNHKNIMDIIQNKFNLNQIKAFPESHYPTKRNVPENFRLKVNKQINWQIENQMGYFQL